MSRLSLASPQDFYLCLACTRHASAIYICRHTSLYSTSLKMSDTLLEALQRLCDRLQRELTLTSVCVYGSILCVSWVFNKLILSPKFSPLNKIPGRPVGWKLLVFGQLTEIFKKDAIDPYIDWVKEMKTGIIRYRHMMGEQRVMIADADGVKDVLVTHSANYLRPAVLFRFFKRVTGSTSLLTLEGHEHAVQRRLCHSAFTQSSVQALSPTFQKHVERLCALWTSEIRSTTEGPAKVDVHKSLYRMTFDIICDSGFGFSSDSLNNPEDKAATAFNFLLSPSTYRPERFIRMTMPTLHSFLPTQYNRKFSTCLNYLHSLICTVIAQKSEKMAGASGMAGTMDLLARLLSARDVESGLGLSNTQLRDHVMTFMLAGHETTASALTWILLILAQNPEIQAKARQEVMSQAPDSKQPITYEDIENMPYINCIVKEVLRLYPPVPHVMRQAVKDMKLCGKFDIPKGTIINVSIGALHRNPAYWGEDAEEFKPERFLHEDNIPQYAFQPFTSGVHMCIGHRFAVLEARMALAVLLRQFEFSPMAGVTYRKRQMITMRPDPPLFLHVRALN